MNNKDQIINKIKTENISIIDDPMLPNKSLFRIDEVANYFDVSKTTIYSWINRGILFVEKYNGASGTTRIPRESILACRFNNRINPLA